MRFPSSDKKPLYSRNFHKATDDPIGNRTTYDTTESGSNVQSGYTSNNLNQYTAITNPTQAPTYDDDGNMLDDGEWDFTWNAENRLIEAVKTDDAKLEFKYDYMGRRVEKKVYSWVSSAWQLDTHLKFVYNGFKQIEELDGADSNAIEKKYVWSGERLLSVTDTDLSATYYYLGDTNKNIGQLIDSSGNIKAKYEYSPFGKTTLSSGNYASHNPFRFSSEFEDGETGLVYYNFRYYSPELGKWLSREPVGGGGANLYAMVSNSPLNLWDYLGLVGLTTIDYNYTGTQTGVHTHGLTTIDYNYTGTQTGVHTHGLTTIDYNYTGGPQSGTYGLTTITYGDGAFDGGGFSSCGGGGGMVNSNPVSDIDALGSEFKISIIEEDISKLQARVGGRTYYAITDDETLTFNGNDVIEESEDGCCATIKKAKDADYKIVTIIPTISSIKDLITIRGYNWLLGHEKRRRIYHALTWKTYISPVVSSGSSVTKCGKLCCCKKGEAKSKLQQYLNDLRSNAKTQMDKYLKEARQAISRENDTLSYVNGLLDFGGVNQIPIPSALKEPACPTCD